MSAPEWRTVPGSRMAASNWYLAFATLIWTSIGVSAFVLAGYSEGLVAWLLVTAGVALIGACSAYVALYFRPHIQVSADAVRFVGRRTSTTIFFKDTLEFTHEMGADLLSEVYMIRTVINIPYMYHIEAELNDGTYLSFDENYGLRAASEHVTHYLDQALREYRLKAA